MSAATSMHGPHPFPSAISARSGGSFPVAPSLLPPLRGFRKDVYSQFGEDGIIEELLRRLGRWDAPSDGRLATPAAPPLWCVEFGAWDGKHLSNTWRLIESRGANAVLIEGDPRRFEALEANCGGIGRVLPVCRMVGWKGESSIYRILCGTACPAEPDVMSIDVDGHDYHIWASLTSYRALIVVCEYNPTMPYEIEYVTPYNPAVRHGSSLAALKALGEKKGYRLVAVTEVNAVFVREDRADEVRIGRPTIKELTEGLPDFRTFLFQTQDGRVGIMGNHHMMWHGALMDADRLPAGKAIPWFPRGQQLPRWLRAHPESFGPIRKALLRRLTARRMAKFERMFGLR